MKFIENPKSINRSSYVLNFIFNSSIALFVVQPRIIRPVFDYLHIFLRYLKYFDVRYIFKALYILINKVFTVELINCNFLSIFYNFIYITGSWMTKILIFSKHFKTQFNIIYLFIFVWNKKLSICAIWTKINLYIFIFKWR